MMLLHKKTLFLEAIEFFLMDFPVEMADILSFTVVKWIKPSWRECSTEKVCLTEITEEEMNEKWKLEINKAYVY